MNDKAEYTVLDDRHETYSIYTSSCTDCQYFNNGKYICTIYPAGIPFDILEGEKECKSKSSIKKRNSF